MGMSAKDLQDVMQIGQIALECDDIVEMRRKVLRCLPSAFGIEKSNFWMCRQYPYPHVDLNDVVYNGIEDQFVCSYVQYYHKMDYYGRFVGTTRNVCSLSSPELCDEMKGEYYNDFLLPQNIHRQLTVYFRAHGQLFAIMGMYRSKSAPPFSSREQAKAQAMANYVSAGLEGAVLKQKARKVEDVIGAVCTDLPYNWLIVLDECLEPIYASNGALAAVSGIDGAVNETDTCPLLPEALRSKCREFSEAARRLTNPVREAVIRYGNAACGQGMTASIRSVKSSKDAELLFILVGDAKAKSSEALRKFGLSRREMEISTLICDGLKNEEIGEKLFISKYTVENHLRSIYRKMDVSNRTSLMSKVAFSRNLQ